MSFQVNVPPSVVAKMTKTEENMDETTEKKKKEDWRKIKELEEARKAGTAPAMQDEEGKDINPHIPQYIMQAPWYTGAVRPTLHHQREPEEQKQQYTDMGKWYTKGQQIGKASTKFRKGACENCGAMGHSKKLCLERPRTRGAQFTNQCVPDDFEQPQLHLSYDGKRDRWNGYDPSEHKKIVEDYQKVEEVKREMKAKKLETSLLGEELGDNAPEGEDEDDEKYADDIAMPGQKFETKQRITVRNLRIREDTAKYLYNLNVDSAFYDPKTRAMRANPFDGSGVDPKELPYAGDNFVRWSGEASDTVKKQMFAWEAYSKGTDVNVQADPTKLEVLHREYLKKKEAHKESAKESLLEKYGGQEHLDAPSKEFLLGQNEEYVEYSRFGTLIKGNKKRVINSRYEEDVLEKNHITVWGSYWEGGKWGYKCCHSVVRGSYCIGEAGLKLKAPNNEDSQEDETEVTKKTSEEPQAIKSSIDSNSLLHQHLQKMQAEERKKNEDKKRHKKKRKHHKRGSSDNSSDNSDSVDDKPKNKKSRHNNDSNSDSKKKKKKHMKYRESSCDEYDPQEKLRKAIEKEKQRQREVEMLMEKGERDRPYNVMYDSKGPTEDDIEAYQRLRMRPDDPMASYLKNRN